MYEVANSSFPDIPLHIRKKMKRGCIALICTWV